MEILRYLMLTAGVVGELIGVCLGGGDMTFRCGVPGVPISRESPL